MSQITYCSCTYGEEEVNTLRGVTAVKPYVDRIILIHDGTLSQIAQDYLKSLGAELYYEPWTDYFSDYRNKYLQRVEHNSFVLCSDPDEFFDELFLKNARDVLEQLDYQRYNRAYIKCYDVWLNDDGTSEEHPTDWYKPTLIFKKQADSYYSGNPHETLHGTWDSIQLQPEYFYRHVKTHEKVLEKSLRNVYVAGGFDSDDRDRGLAVFEYAQNHNCSILEAQAKLEIPNLDEWVELHKICDKLGLNSWTKLRTYCRKGNIDKSLLEWIRSCQTIPKREYSEIYRFYLAIHSEELE